MRNRLSLVVFLFLPLFATTLRAAEPIRFQLHRIGNERTEACCVGDFNGDGRLDIIAGEYLYLAPDWKRIKIREIKTNVDANGKGYAWDFANETMDVDGDGRPDVLSCDWFEAKSMWFRNPGGNLETAGLWEERLIEKNGNFETLDLWDIRGRGKAEDVFPAVQRTVWYEKMGDGTFDVHVVSEKLLAFGNGVGDINGDGRPDLIRPDAWFEAPVDPRTGTWKEHPLDLFGDEKEMKIKDAAQMYVLDVNGDGLGDIIASAAHDYGIFWFEQVRGGGEISWKKHLIDKSFSQVHVLKLADLDGDGQLELLAGKRFMAHDGNDPGEYEPLGIYWFKPIKEGSEIRWEKHVITYDEGIGVGMNLVVVDIDGDGDLDLVTTGKFGGPVLLENLRKR